MRLPLWLVNAALRIGVRRSLARVGDVTRLRMNFERRASLSLPTPPGARIVPVTLAIGDGREMHALRCLRPDSEPRHVILYLHGGAFLAGSPRTHASVAARLGAAAEAEVIVPAYALAPEAPFPRGLEDALLCYRVLLDEGRAAGCIALAGDSAGAGLAAALMLEIEAHALPRPAAAVLFSPWADLTLRAPSLRHNRRSDVMLPVERMAEVVALYLAGHPGTDPRASPVLGCFSDPPPTMILASEHEILRDDAVALAAALNDGPERARLCLVFGVPHAWPVMAGRLAEADRAIEQAGTFLKAHFARPAAGVD